MNWAAIIIIGGLVFFLGVIPLALLHAQHLKKSYGPKQQVSGPKVMQGSLVCQNGKVPTLGKKLCFDYGVNLSADTGDFSGEYHYPSNQREPDLIYTGEVLLTNREGKIRGRSGHKVAEGQLSPNRGDFMLGFPRGSLLGWMSSPFQFGITGEKVVFLNTSKGCGTIDKDSRLQIKKDRITGRLIDWRGAWIIEVDMTYWDIGPEMAVLVILLMSNGIFEFHNR